MYSINPEDDKVFQSKDKSKKHNLGGNTGNHQEVDFHPHVEATLKKSHSAKELTQPPLLPFIQTDEYWIPSIPFGSQLTLNNNTTIPRMPFYPQTGHYMPSMTFPLTPQPQPNLRHSFETSKIQSGKFKKKRNKSKQQLQRQIEMEMISASFLPRHRTKSNFSPTSESYNHNEPFISSLTTGAIQGHPSVMNFVGNSSKQVGTSKPGLFGQSGSNQSFMSKEEAAPKYAHLLNLKKQEVMSSISVFDAGTFKHDKNQYYQPDLSLFEKQAMQQFYSQKYGGSGNYSGAYTPGKEMRPFINKLLTQKLPLQKHLKTYMPIFPRMYKSLDFGNYLGNQFKLQFFGEREVIEPESGEQIQVPKIAQLKIAVKDNMLLPHEETRHGQIELQEAFIRLNKRRFIEYLVEIDFLNIKRIWVAKKPVMTANRFNVCSDTVEVKMFIQMKKPCSTLKFGPCFDFSEVMGGEDTNDKRRDDQENLEMDIIMNSSAKKHNRSRSIDCSPVKSPVKERSGSLEPQRQESKDHMKPIPATVRSPFNMQSAVEKKEIGRNGKQEPSFETLINYWNNSQVLHLEGQANPKTIKAFLDCIRVQNLHAKIYETQDEIQSIGINQIPQEQISRELAKLRDNGQQFTQHLNQMKPSLRFAILALLSQNKFNIFNQGLLEFMAMLNNGGWSSQDDSVADYGAFLIDHINMFKDLNFKDNSVKMIEEEFIRLKQDRQILDEFKKIQNDKNLIRQRRVLITPTLNLFTVAKEEESNKVIRQFKHHLHQFIRLSFVNEQLEKGYYFGDRERFLLGYIHSIVKLGLQVGDNMRLKFLSYSNSQLKNHTAWFLATVNDGVTEDKIISSMGVFEKEANILKRYARRGQCFSTTKFICKLSQQQVEIGVPDIERNGFCFSDGCGYLHPDLAKFIAAERQYGSVSAVQIRLGGAKGVLVVNSEDSFAPNSLVQLRKSQVKFPSQNLSLDIVRCATFSQGFLNRQVIVLLNCLGVPIEYFLRKQQSAKQFIQLDYIQARIQDKIDKFHSKFDHLMKSSIDLGVHYTIEKNKRLSELAKDLKLTLEPCKTFQATLKQALMKGIDVMKDPIMSSIMYSMQLNQYLNLKKKARILLPDSCVLIGVIDPTGTLEENEIFVQIKKDNFQLLGQGGFKENSESMKQARIMNEIDGIPKIIEGDVVVTRNPCVHPGDLRVLQAVDNHALRYLFNVVVFSSKGDRPQCNKMSGGDLDGDVYFVAWDKELLSYIDPMDIKEPADYSKSELIKEKPDSEELPDYFTFYLQRDVLGTVSNLWLRLCDKLGPNGPLDPRCMKLSHMCSVAVDFAKHGECVSKKNFLEMQEEVKNEVPDFMEKSTTRSYESQGVLGFLYRDINTDVALNQFIANEWEASIAKKYRLDSNILDMAKDSREQMFRYLGPAYQKIVFPMTIRLKKIMMNFNLANEGELFACDLRFRLCHLGMNDDQTNYLGDPGSKNEDVIQNLNTMKRKTVDDFKQILREIVAEAQQTDSKAALNFSVALYLATYFDFNEDAAQYFRDHGSNADFRHFCEEVWYPVNKEIQAKTEDKQSFYFKILDQISTFKVACSEAEQGNQKKMRQLMQVKKLFCIPWLLAGDILLINYPDKFDSEEYRQKVALHQLNVRRQTEKKEHQNSVVTVDKAKTMTREQKMSHMFYSINLDNDKENTNPRLNNGKLDQAMEVQDPNEMAQFSAIKFDHLN